MPPGNGHNLQTADVDDTCCEWQAIPIDYLMYNFLSRQRLSVHINELPDKLLLYILQFLPPRELLTTVRAVCRRWRELAMHFDLWMHCCMNVPEKDDVKTACRVMRIAPCLYHLHLDYTEETSTAATLSCNTACSIWSLHLNIHRGMPLDPVIWSLLNQADDVRRLSLGFYAPNINYVAAILRAIADLTLVELRMFCVSPYPIGHQYAVGHLPVGYLHGVVQQNLKLLDLWSPCQIPLAENLLVFFATSVETVVFRTRISRYAFIALYHCPKVTTLVMYPWWRRNKSRLLNPADSDILDKYFSSSSATRLKCLRFEDRNAWNFPSYPDFEVHKLIAALAKSGQSQLETLHLCGMVLHYFNVEILGPALARLPNLSRLETNVIPDPNILAALAKYFPPHLKGITITPCSFSLATLKRIDPLIGSDKAHMLRLY